MDIKINEVADKFGNVLVFMASGNIFLNLTSRRTRRIGRIDRAARVLYLTRKRSRHLFIKMRAYGFNEYLIRNTKDFDKILLEDEYGQYNFPVSLVRIYGKSHLHFKKQGLELQLFLPIADIESYRVEAKTAIL
jgi:hypothetical protein